MVSSRRSAENLSTIKDNLQNVKWPVNCNSTGTNQSQESWEPKAPWDGRVIKGLGLYLSQKERILKEYLKVSLRMGMKRFIYNMENNSAKRPFNIRVSIESPSIPAETQDLRGIGIMDSTLNASP